MPAGPCAGPQRVGKRVFQHAARRCSNSPCSARLFVFQFVGLRPGVCSAGIHGVCGWTVGRSAQSACGFLLNVGRTNNQSPFDVRVRRHSSVGAKAHEIRRPCDLFSMRSVSSHAGLRPRNRTRSKSLLFLHRVCHFARVELPAVPWYSLAPEFSVSFSRSF